MEDLKPSRVFSKAAITNRTLSDEDRKRIERELATIDPLEDKAWKILFSDEDVAEELLKVIFNKTLRRDEKFVINGEIVLSVQGKKIITDSLFSTNLGTVNVEGQGIARDFTFKRHLYYWAALYSSQLGKGVDYEELVPVTSIVLYKDNGEAEVEEITTLKRFPTKLEWQYDDQLKLIAINTAKWENSSDDKMKYLLKLLHEGLASEDIDNPDYMRYKNLMRRACAVTMKTNCEEDSEMKNLLNGYISDEEKAKSEEKGRQEGREEGKIEGKIEVLLSMNYDNIEIADTLNLPVKEVDSIIKRLSCDEGNHSQDHTIIM